MWSPCRAWGCWATLTWGGKGKKHLQMSSDFTPSLALLLPLLPAEAWPQALGEMPRLGWGCWGGQGSYAVLVPFRSRPLRNGCTPHGSGKAGPGQGPGRRPLCSAHFFPGWSRPGGGGWMSPQVREGESWAPSGWLAQPSGPQEYSPSLLTGALSWPHWTLLRRCGYPKRNMKRTAPGLFIEKPSSTQGGRRSSGRKGGWGNQSP